jgi:putative ABC transport system substrate-binding protein
MRHVGQTSDRFTVVTKRAIVAAPTMLKIVILVVLLLFAMPLAAEAQQAGKVFRIGILANLREGDAEGLWTAFVQGLRELGYVESQNITIEWRVSEGRYERLPDLAAELVGRKVDVIVVPADQNALAAKQVTRAIPIVMAGATEPVELGLVTSLARPGGNITGLSGNVGPEIVGKQIELLKTLAPRLSRVAILSNPGNPSHATRVREAGIAARSLKVQIQAVEARAPDELGKAFTTMVTERAGAVLILSDGMFRLHHTLIADLVAKSRLPAMGARDLLNDGILMYYGPNGRELFRRAASYVDKILRGATPADLPVEQPTKFELAINLKAAKALGVSIPRALLLQADQLIE